VFDLKNVLSRLTTDTETQSLSPASIAVGKPFAWQMKDAASNLPNIQWDKVSNKGELKKDMRLDHGSVLVYKDSTVLERVATATEGVHTGGGRSGGGGGIKIYSFQEQLERAAGKKIQEAEAKKVDAEARNYRAELIAENEVVGASTGMHTTCSSSEGTTGACPNAKCKCTTCSCGKGCTCGISKDVTCDPCRAFKRSMEERVYSMHSV